MQYKRCIPKGKPLVLEKNISLIENPPVMSLQKVPRRLNAVLLYYLFGGVQTYIEEDHFVADVPGRLAEFGQDFLKARAEASPDNFASNKGVICVIDTAYNPIYRALQSMRNDV